MPAPSSTYEADIAVVGAGMAGLVAAVQAQELGASVVLLEKGDVPGGSMAMSGGAVWCPKSFDDIRYLVPLGDPGRQRVLADGFLDGVRWLMSIGADLREVQAAPYRGIARRVYQMEPSPADFTRHMAIRFTAGGGRLVAGATAQHLTTDVNGRTSGLTVVTADGLMTVRAGAVILATGGFQGNNELMARYFGQWSDRLILRGNPHNTGDGFLIATDAGAASSRAMSSFYGHLLPAPPARVPADNFVGYTQYHSYQALLVNRLGGRFHDESTCDELNAQAVARQHEAKALMIFDEAVHTAHGFRAFRGNARAVDVFENCRNIGARALIAPTIDELAAKVEGWGYHASGTVETIREYNEAVATERSGQMRIPRREHPNPVSQPPYYALEVTPGVTMTYGGITTDSNSQVIGRTGRPVPGLYAAGADAGGIYNEGYAGGLCLGLVFGRIAARHAVSGLSR